MSMGRDKENSLMNAAYEAWLASEEGSACSEMPKSKEYLMTRLRMAYLAGWDGSKSAGISEDVISQMRRNGDLRE